MGWFSPYVSERGEELCRQDGLGRRRIHNRRRFWRERGAQMPEEIALATVFASILSGRRAVEGGENGCV